MASDGLNDLSALAKSGVSVVISAKIDVTIESIIITLVNGNLHQILRT
jgi:cation transport ATPase